MSDSGPLPALCLSCGERPNQEGAAQCPACGGRRIIRHAELDSLSLAHVDCDAFYAAIEKRDDPSLADKPVIVGGSVRGVVTTACYVARTYGVRSAMPMFKALKACPDAVVIRPNFTKYAEAAREIRAMMETLTPMVEPVSIDEAFLDLAGTTRVHRMSPAAALAGLQRTIKREVGITVSIGLSCNKFLAKIASDLDKPNGFSIIGAREAKSVLAPLPVTAIWGVGTVFAMKLNKDGFHTIGDIQRADASALARRYGELGARLCDLSHGRDRRCVSTSRETKSVSSETTFNSDIMDIRELEAILWRLAERTSARMKAKELQGRVVTLKLKTHDFRTITRRSTLPYPSNLAHVAFKAAEPMLAETAGGGAFRLIGIGYSALEPAVPATQSDLFGAPDEKRRREEGAIDAIRRKFGDDAIALGRSYAKRPASGRIKDNDGEEDG